MPAGNTGWLGTDRAIRVNETNWNRKQYASTRQINYTQSFQQIECFERTMLHQFLEINVIDLPISISILDLHKNVTYRPTSINTRSFLMDVNTHFESQPTELMSMPTFSSLHAQCFMKKSHEINTIAMDVPEVPQGLKEIALGRYTTTFLGARKQKLRNERITFFLSSFVLCFQKCGDRTVFNSWTEYFWR